MKANLLTFTRVYGHLRALTCTEFRLPFPVARLTKALRCADVSLERRFEDEKKLPESAAKLLKSFARVNLLVREAQKVLASSRAGPAPRTEG